MEDLGIKAIVIGVSLFVTMMTLTAIIMYFDTARSAADVVSKRQDIASSLNDIVNSDNFETKLTGVQIRSLINKYAGNETIEINIIKIGGQETTEYNNVNNEWLTVINENSELISEEKLDIINPVWNNKVDKVEKSGKIILEISLNI